MKIYTVYVLKSRQTGKWYVGSTQDLHQRVKQHNLGRCFSTKRFAPWDVLYSELYRSRREAIKQERYFKTGAGRKRLMKILT